MDDNTPTRQEVIDRLTSDAKTIRDVLGLWDAGAYAESHAELYDNALLLAEDMADEALRLAMLGNAPKELPADREQANCQAWYTIGQCH